MGFNEAGSKAMQDASTRFKHRHHRRLRAAQEKKKTIQPKDFDEEDVWVKPCGEEEFEHAMQHSELRRR